MQSLWRRCKARVMRSVKRKQAEQNRRLGLTSLGSGTGSYSMAATVKRASVSPALHAKIDTAQKLVKQAVAKAGGRDYYSVYVCSSRTETAAFSNLLKTLCLFV